MSPGSGATRTSDALERFYASIDRPGLGWWAHRALWSLVLVTTLCLRLLVESRARTAWGLLLLGGMYAVALVAWPLNRWWLRRTLETWGFGLQGILAGLGTYGLPMFLIWAVGAACRALGVAGVSQVLSAGNVVLALVISVELFLALFRTRGHYLEAREAQLKARLAPHFIFNTLNTLQAQIDLDPAQAKETTQRLAHLFRQVVELADQRTIPLSQELTFVEAYLGIEKARLGGRLQVRMAVPEDLESVAIPPLSLQVLVENAIKHGLAPLERGGEIVVGAKRAGDGRIELWVEDPGNGASPVHGTGTALATLRQRLERPEDLQMSRIGDRHRVGFHWRDRLDAPTAAPRGMGIAASLGLVLLFFLLMFPAGILMVVLGFVLGPAGRWMVGRAVLAGCLAVTGLIGVLILRRPLKDLLRRPALGRRAWGRFVLVGLALSAGEFAVFSLPVLHPWAVWQRVPQEVGLGKVLVVGTFLALGEELLLRGVFCQGLGERFGPRVGRTAAALLSILVGARRWAQAPGRFLLGLLVGAAWERSGSILPGALLQVLNFGLLVGAERAPGWAALAVLSLMAGALAACARGEGHD